jgi:enoyl-CoA hydratase/3-hydroxyacyl-CoA dehydrogenase
MSFTYMGRTLDVVGVVGSGQIGPDIALYFSKVLAPFGVRIVVVDISEKALEQGSARLVKKVDRGVQSGAFSPEQGEAMKQSVTFTGDYAALAGAGLVVEAATEDEGIKSRIFGTLEKTCAADAVLVSNSSHMEPEVVAGALLDRGRSAVVHYFFPAERNPVVEIVPGKDTDPALTQWLMRFYERIGKVPIRVKSRYGYAVDPVFEGIFHAAANPPHRTH